jgi:transposase
VTGKSAPLAFAQRRQEETERTRRDAARLAALRAGGMPMRRAAAIVGVSERTGWRYLRIARQQSQAGR